MPPVLTPSGDLEAIYDTPVTIYSSLAVTWSLSGPGSLETLTSTSARFSPENFTGRSIVTATAGDASTATKTIYTFPTFPCVPDGGSDAEEVEQRASMQMEDGRLITALIAPPATEITLKFTARRRAEFEAAYEFLRRNATTDFYVRDFLAQRLYKAKANGNLKHTFRLANLVNFEVPIYAISFINWSGGYGISPFGFTYGG